MNDPSGEIAQTATNLVETLAQRSRQNSDDLAFRFLDFDTNETHTVTYSELFRRARGIAGYLSREFAPGERAMLIYEPGLSFIYAYFGCLMASIVAVPTYPPTGGNFEGWKGRVSAFLQDSGARCILASSLLASVVEQTGLKETHSVSIVNTEALPWPASGDTRIPEISADAIAFLQYTSGSTRAPKGVVVSHGNLMANIRAMLDFGRYTKRSVFLSWLPQYHDMGLIAGTLLPVYVGGCCTFMSPIAFLQRPYRWLEAMSRFKAEATAVPNFALDLCVAKIKPAERDTLNLESLRVAINGSEPVSPRSLARFAEYFAPCGFQVTALCPAYGLAESTLAVTISDWRRPPITKTFSRQELEQGVAKECHPATDAVALVSCGAPVGENQITIVNPESGDRCAPGTVGEICVSGNSVAQGYWNNATDTELSFTAHSSSGAVRLKTGDLGFFHKGQLYVTGRMKEMIIIRGRNIAPYDIEEAGGTAHPALRRGCGVAFSVLRDASEQIVFLQEMATTDLTDAELDDVIAAIRAAIRTSVGTELSVVGLLEKGAIPKTTSGKLQRKRTRELFLDGSLHIVHSWLLAGPRN